MNTVELAPRTGLIGRPLANGLALPADLTFEEWAGALHHADMIVESSPWWLADLMAYGEAHFGERHTHALPTADEDPHGVKQSRLKQAAWMAQKYPRNSRYPSLSYTHHRAVAELEPAERDELLQEATRERLSTRELLARVKQVQADQRAITAESAPVCAADSPWPTKDDLLPEWRQRLEAAALAADLADPQGFTCGYLAALVDSHAESAFRSWREEE